MRQIESKILQLRDFLPLREKIRAEGGKVVFTNGCFDIIHRGHIEYLEKARSYGDYLVVGLNSDRSVREIKGPERPIILQDDRAIVLAALQMVDSVIIFDDPTPADLIETIRPDILAKGSDWSEEQIVGADTVKAGGGEVVRIELTDGRSTSSIIDKILSKAKGA